MKTEFVNANTLTSAKRLAPWAARIAKVEGGYLAFESIEDYQTWTKQK